MVSFESQKKSRTYISLTPLIDVVFILLIFFMLATSFTKWNAMIFSSSQSSQKNESDLKGTLVKLTLNNQYLISGKSYSLVELKSYINLKKNSDPNHYLVIEAEKEIALQKIVDFMTVMKPVIGNNISIAKSI